MIAAIKASPAVGSADPERGVWTLVAAVSVPYWLFLMASKVFSYMLMTAGQPGIIIAPPYLRIAQYLLLLPLLLVFYRYALAIGWDADRRARSALPQIGMALLFAMLARPMLVSLVAAQRGDPKLMDELFHSDFGTLWINLWASSALEFLLAYGAGLALVFGVQSFLALRRETRRAAELQDQWLRSRLQTLRIRTNPHFVVNTLRSAMDSVHTAPARAEQLLERLAQLLGRTLNGSGDDFVPLADEVATVRCYLDIQQLRFPGVMHVEVDVDPGAANCLLPGLVLQPIVEDAIVRTAVGSAQRVELRLAIVRHGEQIGVTVSARRLPPSGAPDIAPTPGLLATRERLRALFGDRQQLVTDTVGVDDTYSATLLAPALEPAPALALAANS